jgi:hypothetical protein
MVGTTTESQTGDNSMSLESDWSSLYVAGRWISRENRHVIKDQNPYTGEVIAEVPTATAEDVDLAFDTGSRSSDVFIGRTPKDLAQPILEGINIEIPIIR